MITLQDLKDKLQEVEYYLPSGVKMEDIPMQHNITDSYVDLDINVYTYLGHLYGKVEIE